VFYRVRKALQGMETVGEGTMQAPKLEAQRAGDRGKSREWGGMLGTFIHHVGIRGALKAPQWGSG